MHATKVIVAISFIVNLFLAAPVSAQTNFSRPDSSAPKSGQTEKGAMPKSAVSAGSRQPERATGGRKALPLSEAECTALGGTTINAGVCISGKACSTVDEKKQQHAVCISKQQ